MVNCMATISEGFVQVNAGLNWMILVKVQTQHTKFVPARGLFWNRMASQVCDGSASILRRTSRCYSFWLAVARGDSKIRGVKHLPVFFGHSKTGLGFSWVNQAGKTKSLGKSRIRWKRSLVNFQSGSWGLEIPTLILAWKSDAQHPLESAQMLHVSDSAWNSQLRVLLTISN